jgi:hypothetical protein
VVDTDSFKAEEVCLLEYDAMQSGEIKLVISEGHQLHGFLAQLSLYSGDGGDMFF